MFCRSCKKNIDENMKHAITANLCPFCGNQIFSLKELSLRKSLSRILIKNGLDNDDQIGNIVNDMLGLSSNEVDPVIDSSPLPINLNADNDGLTPQERSAPARVLTAAPRPSAQDASAGGIDPMALAMRVFEEENADPFKRTDDNNAQAEDNDVTGIFFMERGGGEEVEKKRELAKQARAAGLTGGGPKRTTPAFNRAK